MAFPTYRTGSVVTANTGNQTSFAVPKPNGLAQDDLIAAVFGFNSTSTTSTLTGWTRDLIFAQDGSRLEIWTRKATAGDVSSWSHTINYANSNIALAVAAFLGHDLTTWTVDSDGRQNATSTTHAVPASTTTRPDCLIIGGIAIQGSRTYSSGTGTVLGSSSRANVSAAMLIGNQSPNPGTTNPEFTLTINSTSAANAGAIAIQPPEPVGGSSEFAGIVPIF